MMQFDPDAADWADLLRARDRGRHLSRAICWLEYRIAAAAILFCLFLCAGCESQPSRDRVLVS